MRESRVLSTKEQRCDFCNQSAFSILYWCLVAFSEAKVAPAIQQALDTLSICNIRTDGETCLESWVVTVLLTEQSAAGKLM